MAEQNGRTEMQEMDALRNTWSWSKRWSANRKKGVMSSIPEQNFSGEVYPILE